MNVWVVCCNNHEFIGHASLESWEVDSVWTTEEAAVAYLNELTGTTMDEDFEWYMGLDVEGRDKYNVYHIEEVEVNVPGGDVG